MERFFHIDAYCRTGTTIEIGTDASPWGLGGWLSIDGVVTHYFACPITKEDVSMFSTPTGSADGQQLWECLAVLVAIDVWSSLWNQQRIVLKVRGDHVGTLTLLIKMHSRRLCVPTLSGNRWGHLNNFYFLFHSIQCQVYKL